ncbi:hypothetical protein E2C01_095931 [Portunus trituberculatus]|uniref:Uncharacterized protein n=1 Tax=Portunus trituberculatus TaxID=210409 RepID=A0A5B7K5A8_PORTR|nr:hypothetical protein [Portunus trituberculatus]
MCYTHNPNPRPSTARLVPWPAGWPASQPTEVTLGGGLTFLQDVFVSMVKGGTDDGGGGGGGGGQDSGRRVSLVSDDEMDVC